MPTVIISHRLSLVGCLVAAALRLYFQARNLKIIVVESLDTSFTSQPFCGISTISNQRLAYNAFLQRAFFQGLLAPSLTFLESIQIHNSPLSRPEFPNSQHKVLACLGLPAQFLALVYHPQVLLNSLRQSLSADPLITFLSVLDRGAIAQLQGDCYINFSPGEYNNKTENLDLAAHSCLFPMELRQQLVLLLLQQAPPMLWLPSFKASTQMFEAIFTSTASSTRASLNIEVHSVNLNIHENSFASRYDLNHGIKACDYVLQLMESLATRLGLVPSRL